MGLHQGIIFLSPHGNYQGLEENYSQEGANRKSFTRFICHNLGQRQGDQGGGESTAMVSRWW